jgi:hypothetical protein
MIIVEYLLVILKYSSHFEAAVAVAKTVSNFKTNRHNQVKLIRIPDIHLGATFDSKKKAH